MKWKERVRVAECLELAVLFRGKRGCPFGLGSWNPNTRARAARTLCFSNYTKHLHKPIHDSGCNVNIACWSSRRDPSLALPALSICPDYPRCRPAQYPVTSLQDIRVDPPRCTKKEAKSCQTADATIGREGVERRSRTQHVFRLWGD